jgi:hypothetical protein
MRQGTAYILRGLPYPMTTTNVVVSKPQKMTVRKLVNINDALVEALEVIEEARRRLEVVGRSR